MPDGSCLCGAVTFQVRGDLGAPSACHCSQCRKQSGHVWAATYVPEGNLTLTKQASLRWFSASPTAKRGFCGTCGSFLFWKHLDQVDISISMGAFEQSTGATLARHIFVANKGDYYDITDDLPKLETS